jgi:hypothetical protein
MSEEERLAIMAGLSERMERLLLPAASEESA